MRPPLECIIDETPVPIPEPRQTHGPYSGIAWPFRQIAGRHGASFVLPVVIPPPEPDVPRRDQIHVAVGKAKAFVAARWHQYRQSREGRLWKRWVLKAQVAPDNRSIRFWACDPDRNAGAARYTRGTLPRGAPPAIDLASRPITEFHADQLAGDYSGAHPDDIAAIDAGEDDAPGDAPEAEPLAGETADF